MRKMPVKTATVNLKDEYEGWNFVARTNPPIGVFGLVASGNFDKIVEGLSLIIRSWNFVDEEGKDLEVPSVDTVSYLPLDLITMVANEYVGAINAVPKN